MISFKTVTLFEFGRTFGMIPQSTHIIPQCQELLSRGITKRATLLVPQGGEFLFKARLDFQRCINGVL